MSGKAKKRRNIYRFKPLVIIKHKAKSLECPKARSGHRIACDHRYLYSYGGFNPCVPDTDPDMRDDQTWVASKPLFKELWRYNFMNEQWKRLPGQESMPNELASNAMILCGNTLMVYGGTGVPFGERCSNQLYVCNVDDGMMKIVPAVGEPPEPQYGQVVIIIYVCLDIFIFYFIIFNSMNRLWYVMILIFILLVVPLDMNILVISIDLI